MQPCNFLQFECLVDPNCDWVLASSILSCNSSKSGRKWLHLPQVWVWNWLWLGSNWAILGSFDFVEHVLYMHQSGQLHIVGYNHIYWDVNCLQNGDELTITRRSWETSCLQMPHVDWEASCLANAAFGLRHRLFANVTCGLRETKCWNANKIWKVGFHLKSCGFQLGQQFKKLFNRFLNAHHEHCMKWTSLNKFSQFLQLSIDVPVSF
jgi:hypothetical protein